MSLLTTLLDTYIFSGVPANATWDVIKLAWAKAQEKSWEDLYLASFQQTVSDLRPILAKYSPGSGDVTLLKADLQRVLCSESAGGPGQPVPQQVER
jgi:hypothetical protein